MYRGKRVDGKGWVEGWYIEADGKSFIVKVDSPIQDYGRKMICGLIEVIPSSVGQSIGQNDKNGIDLDWWERDVFKFLNGMVAEIVFEKGGWYFKDAQRDHIYSCYNCVLFREIPKKIGNVTDNPELGE